MRPGCKHTSSPSSPTKNELAKFSRWSFNNEEKTCYRLAASPQIGTLRGDLAPNLRCFSVGMYVIYFRPIEGEIEIVRVLYGARDPISIVPE